MRNLSINDHLYLTLPIYSDKDDAAIIAYVHSAPLSREIFEAHFSLIAQTFAQIYTGGYGITAGPRISSMILQRVARESDDTQGGIALMNEIRRLTNVLYRTDAGWEHFTLHDIVERKMIHEDDISEVVNAIVFFTVASSMHRRRDRKMMLSGALKMWGAEISSSDFMALVALHGTSKSGDPTMKSQSEASSVVF